jgi:hypothetical protein
LRRHLAPSRIRNPDIRQQLWPSILKMPNIVAIGRGPRSRQASALRRQG